MEEGSHRAAAPLRESTGLGHMLKNLKVRTKLAVVLAVPLLALLAVGAIGVYDRRHDTVDARNFALGVTSALLLSLLLASLVARSIATPLSRLTQAANTLAGERLPALVEQLRNPAGAGAMAPLVAIPVRSKDEIGQLAQAINSIQGVATTVAEEQATLLRKGIGDIFVSLARRNQTLLDRQIEFIDQLESAEVDPDQLENLFRLDHLATRMRRNAESLLVLAGAEPARRRGRPVDISDVVRVAVGEVEHFARVQLLALDEAIVIGGVAVDLAHLLAELMENATQFSPPDTRVEIVGHRARDGEYLLTVTDQGIGMNADQLSDANRTIANPPSVGLSISRSLGFTVIGRLAQRHGMSVRLAASPTGGVSAAVLLPIATTDPDAAPATQPPMVEATRSASEFAIPAAPEATDLGWFDEPARAERAEHRDIADLFEPAAGTEPAPVTLAAAAPLPPPPPPAPEDAAPFLPPPPPPAPAPLAPPESASPVIQPGVLTSAAATPELRNEMPVPPTVTLPPVPTRSPVSAPSPLSPLAAPTASAAAFEGLTRRVPRGEAPADPRPTAPVTASQRSPEEVRQMLSRYRSGLKRGRTEDEQTGSDPT
jgi:signal transduction histidine kinase